jgi:hypothetical protein
LAKRRPKEKAGRAPELGSGAESIVEQGWIDAGEGYLLALEEKKLVCRNSSGKRLVSVPKPVQQSPAAQQLLALRDWLEQHERACAAAVETWMLRSLPIPLAVILQIFGDSAWRKPLENAVVLPLDGAGAPQADLAGFLRAADLSQGVGVVDLDGETRWLKAERLAIPHPILLPPLDDLRELASQLQLQQGIAQLFRETFSRDTTHDPAATRITGFAGGKFAQLMHAVSKSRQLGYRVRGGFACCPVFEGGRRVEARYWIGADAPEAETYTADLCFVDEREQPLPLARVGPVALSEGMRMATAIFGGRVVEKEQT